MWKIMRENLEDLTSPNLWRSLAAELVGTLFLVLLGCGSMAGPIFNAGQQPEVVQVSLTFGLVVATMVWCIGHVSGGYINPAVTLGAVVTRRISIVRGLLYIVAQVLGGLVGAGMLFGLSPDNARAFLGVNSLRHINEAQGFGVELLVTFVLVFTVLASTDEKRTDRHGSAPLTIGLAVTACHLFAFNFTHCGMNPARSFAPAVVTGYWDDHWVFWVGPIVGGVAAALLYEYIFSAGATFSRTRRCMLRSRAKPEAPEGGAAVEADKTEMITIEDAGDAGSDEQVKLTSITTTEPNGTEPAQ